MAKAVTSKTESLTIRVPVELISQWREAAQKADISVAALVIDLAKRGARLSAQPLFGNPVLADPVPRDIAGEVTPRFRQPIKTGGKKR